MEFDPKNVLAKLSESRDKVTLNRKINMFRLNFKGQKEALFFINKLDRLTRIRR